MTELPPQLRLVRDFFFKQASSLPPERSYLHHPGLVENQTIFRLEDLRRHLNNPFLRLEFLQIVDRGKLVDTQAARCVKIVQRRPIEFVNRRVLQDYLERGAACLLEGVDILEPQVSLLAAILDRAHSCTFSNAVVFFSQRGNEAYRGHLDTDDVLAIHLAGAKKWRIHARQAPRRSHLVELEESEMGPLETEIVMRPGDVLYLRSGTPHRVETVGDYSMHLSFDLCDRGAVIETVFDLLLKHYDRDALRPYGAAQEVLEKAASLGRSETFTREFNALQQQRKSGYEEFRSIAASRITFFDRLIGSEQAASRSPDAAAG
ncbi:MAG TPA: cupin domain-containing protein [Burkholderiales bacterium]|nr:cupin domain-containing protein [Burkholderiales bacterium]